MKAPILTVAALLAIVLLMLVSLVSARSDTTALQTRWASVEAMQIHG